MPDWPRALCQFIAQDHGVELWDEAFTGQIYLGAEEFVQQMQAFAADRDARKVPGAQRRAASMPLQWYFDQCERDLALARAFVEGGYTQSALAEKTGLSVSRISRVIKAVGAKARLDLILAGIIRFCTGFLVLKHDS